MVLAKKTGLAFLCLVPLTFFISDFSFGKKLLCWNSFESVMKHISQIPESRRVWRKNKEKLSSQIGKFLLTETQEGRDLLEGISGIGEIKNRKDTDYPYHLLLQKIKKQKYADEVSTFIEKIQQAEVGIQRFRNLHDVPLDQIGLSRTEKQLLRNYLTSIRDIDTTVENYRELLTVRAESYFANKLFSPFPKVAKIRGKLTPDGRDFKAKNQVVILFDGLCKKYWPLNAFMASE